MSCCVHLEAGAELWRKRVTGEVSISRTCGHHHPSSGKKKSPSSCRIPLSLCVLSALFSFFSLLRWQQRTAGAFLLACQPAMTQRGQRENIQLSPHSASPQPHTAPNMYRRCSVTASGERREALFCSSRLTFSTGTHPCFKCSQCLYQTCSFVSN